MEDLIYCQILSERGLPDGYGLPERTFEELMREVMGMSEQGESATEPVAAEAEETESVTTENDPDAETVEAEDDDPDSLAGEADPEEAEAASTPEQTTEVVG